MALRYRRLRMACVAVGLAAAITVGVANFSSNATDFAQPFADDSPFRTPIASGAVVDPNSAAMIKAVTGDGNLHAGLVEFGIPIFEANANTPRYTVPCRETNWGRCPFDGLRVPIPDEAHPHTGSDGAMVIVDPASRTSYEFWRARKEHGSWTTEFAAVNSLDGSGWGGAVTGSGAARLAGVIRIAEIEQNYIGHALAMQSNNVCANVFRAPALKTDGKSTKGDCLPEGARLQLDPALDLNTLQLSRAEYTVAKAMQTFGGFIVDVSGTSLSASFELDHEARSNYIGSSYTNAGLRWDYDGMTDIPWQRLRVMQ